MAENSTDPASLFEAELAKRNLKFRVLEDGRYELLPEVGDARTISIENLVRRVSQSGDDAAVARFVDAALADLKFSLPPWDDAQRHVFPMLDASPLHVGSDALTRDMSDETVAVLVFYDEAAGQIQFLRSVDLAGWGVTEEAVWSAAEIVLDRVMAATEIGILDAGDFELGTLEAPEPWKASLIRSRELRAKVEADLGWPIHAVAPDRGFVYLLSQQPEDPLSRIGGVVVSEFQSAPYPISTEVWELSDDGIRAIGAFPTA